jgi:ATP-dependent 26S proteasome regulatory subunit
MNFTAMTIQLETIFIIYYILPPSQIDKSRLKQGSRVALDMTTLTIMRQLPREVDPLVFSMSIEDPGDVSYSSVGGLGEQIRELREVGWDQPWVILYICKVIYG